MTWSWQFKAIDSTLAKLSKSEDWRLMNNDKTNQGNYHVGGGRGKSSANLSGRPGSGSAGSGGQMGVMVGQFKDDEIVENETEMDEEVKVNDLKRFCGEPLAAIENKKVMLQDYGFWRNVLH